jgi:hypothetical protein
VSGLIAHISILTIGKLNLILYIDLIKIQLFDLPLPFIMNWLRFSANKGKIILVPKFIKQLKTENQREGVE